MTSYLAGHLGARVSALVDGQMSHEEADRAWAHVQACRLCYEQVGREGWVKSQLAGLSTDGRAGASASLKGALAGFTPASVGRLVPVAPAAPVAHTAPASPLRPAGLMILGGGALSAAMLGVLALGAAPTADSPAVHRDVVSPARSTTVGVSVTGPIEPVSLERPRAVGVIAHLRH